MSLELGISHNRKINNKTNANCNFYFKRRDLNLSEAISFITASDKFKFLAFV